ncbi:Cytochrome P450 [Gossypium arboreum]|uniref:Cytochrome P450 n=1 Tax=Gossypium arboreum TaxID=29729 RepID=A0A0B0NYT2_GOSAR|nr:Cytochrome P450 [Gossypium arboreum]
MVFKLRMRSNINESPKSLPPAPWKLPILGHLHLLMFSLPCPLDGISQKAWFLDAPTTWPFLLVAEIILYNFSDIGFAPYGGHWRQLRKVCTLELLSTKREQSFRSIREEQISSLKEFVEALGSFSIIDLFPSIKLLPVISGRRAKFETFHHDLDAMLQSIIEEHRSSKANPKDSNDVTDDLVDVLLNLQDHGGLEFPLTTDSIKAAILDMFIVGTETSSAAVEWAMSEMIKNPRILEKAKAEVRQVYDRTGDVNESDLHKLKYLKLVIKETLRLHPPLPLLLPREDSNYWNEAESFNPERFINSSVDYKGTNFEFIPFGAGRRRCPGMSYGMAAVELSLAQLLYHFDWKLPNRMKNEDLDMTEAFGASGRRKRDLYLIPIPYHPPCVG